MRVLLHNIRLRRTSKPSTLQGEWRWSFSKNLKSLQLLDEISFASIIKVLQAPFFFFCRKVPVLTPHWLDSNRLALNVVAWIPPLDFMTK